MIEANRASSSAKLVSISTWVLGRWARMSRVASIPEPSERRTSITTMSGRAWAATATASRTELASAHTTTSTVSVSSSLMPSRTTSWSSTSITRSGGALIGSSSQGWLKPARFVISGRISVRTSSWTGDKLLVVGLGVIGDRLTNPVEEVLDGGLGDPVQQHPVDRSPEGSQGWPVAGADGQLGPVLANGAELDVGGQRSEEHTSG